MSVLRKGVIKRDEKNNKYNNSSNFDDRAF